MDVVVVGSVNVDMVVKSARIPAVGETVTGGEFLMAAGGKGANQAVAAARLGAKVALVARVGGDVFGDEAIAGFRREGIDTSQIGRSSSATGVALILVGGDGANLISVAPGANFALSVDDVDRAADVIRAAKVLLLQLEVPMDVVARAARIAESAGVPVILDPAPAAAVPGELFPRLSVLKPNETEAAQLAGRTVDDFATAEAAGKTLLARGCRNVVITLGEKGSLWCSAAGARHFAAPAVGVVDTTAAGDAYSGALAFGLAAGLSVEDAIRQATLVGSLATTRLGAQPSMPTCGELADFARRVG